MLSVADSKFNPKIESAAYLVALENVLLTTLDTSWLNFPQSVAHKDVCHRIKCHKTRSMHVYVYCWSDEKCTAVFPTGCHITSILDSNISYCAIEGCSFFSRRVFQMFFGLTFLQWIYFTPKNAFILSSTLNVYIIVYFPSKLAFFFILSVSLCDDLDIKHNNMYDSFI